VIVATASVPAGGTPFFLAKASAVNMVTARARATSVDLVTRMPNLLGCFHTKIREEYFRCADLAQKI
jgi:hypothetical protein